MPLFSGLRVCEISGFRVYRPRIQVVRLRVVGSSMPLLKSVRASFLGGGGRGLGEFSGTGSRVTGGLNSFALFRFAGFAESATEAKKITLILYGP